MPKEIAHITDLQPDPQNANLGTERGMAMLDYSLEEYGVGRGIVADKNGLVIGGNKTREQAAAKGIDIIPVHTDGTKLVVTIRDDLDLTIDPKAKGLALADNRVNEVNLAFDPIRLEAYQDELDLGQLWNEEEWAGIRSAAENTGLNGDGGAENAGADVAPEVDRAVELQEQYGTQCGQLWELGTHRLACGDCTDRAVVEAVMKGEAADIAIHDPPYGMRLNTDWSAAKSEDFAADKHVFGGRKYKKVEGDFVDYDPTFLFAQDVPTELFLWGADYYAERIPERNTGSWLIWDKRIEESADLMLGSAFETCWSYQKHKREILRVKWAGIFGMEQEHDRKRYHPTQKPTLLYEKMLASYSQSGQISADFYLGAGSHLLACENLNRKCRAIEIDPGYVAVVLHRWATLTGKEPKLIED